MAYRTSPPRVYATFQIDGCVAEVPQGLVQRSGVETMAVDQSDQEHVTEALTWLPYNVSRNSQRRAVLARPSFALKEEIQ